MDTFRLNRAGSVREAVQLGSQSDARYVAGGTTLVDLMKLSVERPRELIDINTLPLDRIERDSDGALRIGAMVRNSDLARHPEITRNYAVLSQALLSGASPQLRNMATTGGNLLQRTRCTYFRDVSYRECNKRSPGSGCAAMDGYNRSHAILGTSEHCIATHPSDMAVAMLALEAVVHIQGPGGPRTVPVADFHLLPGSTPHIENVMRQGELITAVVLPPMPRETKSLYLKLRDRASYEFALASAAVALQKGGATIHRVRIAMGGVGTKPWRSEKAEQMLQGKTIDKNVFAAAADAFLEGARPQHDNAFKIELARRCLVRALTMAAA
jgi:xanthine dehydrogenase YagS FAD-binding subunit